MENTKEKIIEEAVWRHFACNYGEPDWPQGDPADFLAEHYKDGYAAYGGKQIIIWEPYEAKGLDELLTAIEDYEAELKSTCEKYMQAA